jgi:hypothetical protein
MPISIEAFATPQFTRIPTGYPYSTQKTDRFNEINPKQEAGRFIGTEGREGGWKQGGYNPNHQTTRIEKIRVRSDDITLKPY